MLNTSIVIEIFGNINHCACLCSSEDILLGEDDLGDDDYQLGADDEEALLADDDELSQVLL